MSEDTLNIDKKVAFSASTPDGDIDFSHSEFKERVGEGFNQHGVRKNFDEGGNLESVDVIYEAMEPGPPERRNGVRITKGFLDKVGSKDYDDPPHLKDHDDKDTFSKIGSVKEAWFSDRIGKLMLMTRTPNIEGSSNHSEAIARYTHEPPSITDGSLGFGNEYEAIRNEDGEPEMKDGKFREFSTTNFPGGYDEGGVKAAFEEAIEDLSFAEYQHATGDWVNRSYQGGTVHAKVRNRTKDSFTVDGNTIEGDEGEPVYKLEEYKDGEFTGQMIAAAQSSVSSWSGPKNMSESEAYSRMTFAEDEEDSVDSVYSEWSDAVNMTASQLDSWSDHPCADTASNDPEAVRERNMMLLETNKSEWGSDEVEAAKRTISFIARMSGSKPEGDPSEGGEGTCPSEWAVSMLNWAYNPFDDMPDGNPNPGESSVTTKTIEFSGHMEEKSKIYSMWEEMTNMSEEMMNMWEAHPCSNKGVDKHEDHRDNFYMLMGQPIDSWGLEEMQIANRAINYMAEAMEKEPDNPEDGGPGTCPSRWAVNLLNRGHNPFDSFPSGNPQFSREKVGAEEFDDAAQDDDKSVENSAAKGFAVKSETIQF